MSLFEFLTKDEKKNYEEDLFYETGKSLGMTDSEIKEALKSGISPEEWLEENDYENFLDQDLDK